MFLNFSFISRNVNSAQVAKTAIQRILEIGNSDVRCKTTYSYFMKIDIRK